MPLFQGVVLETASMLLHMNFTANLSSTNRLLFPYAELFLFDFHLLVETTPSDSIRISSATLRRSERMRQ
jgi:hypothetical protein